MEINYSAALVSLALACLAFILWRWKQISPKPHIKFSNLGAVPPPNSGRIWLAKGSRYLFAIALGSFLLALTDPHFFLDKKTKGSLKPPVDPTEGIAIYLALDQSGSMTEVIPAYTKSGGRQNITKINLVKQVSSDFVRDRPNDLIGLIFFARIAQIISPLTLDHQAILDDIAKFDHISDPNLDGTAIGYAIFKAANLIAATQHYAKDLIAKGKPAYQIKNAILVIVTDGLQDPSAMDEGNRLRFMSLQEASQYAKDKGVKVYLINVDPSIVKPEFEPHRNLMKRITELTGGKFYIVDGTNSLDRVFDDIGQLEKSKLPDDILSQVTPKDQLPNLYTRVSLYPYLILLGLIALGLGLLLRTTLFRSVP